MSLSGTLGTFPLPDLLQWLGTARKTGTLYLKRDRLTKRVFLKEGRVISSASDDPTEQLGQFLLSRGRITEEDLRRGLEAQAKTKILLGKILLMVGAIREEDLREMLVAKAQETILSIFLWEDAHFEFLDGDLPERLFVPISLDVQDVLLAGLTMVDELRHMREDLGASGTVLARTGKPFADGGDPEGSARRAALDLVDARRSIADIGLAAHSSEFAVFKLMHGLYEDGYVTVARKAEPADGGCGPGDRGAISPEILLARGREMLASGDAEGAVVALHQAMAAAPRDLEIANLYDLACKEFRDRAYRHFLPPGRIPRLVRDMASLTHEALTPEEAFLVSRINGTWDLKSIIDISPLAEVDALRIMKRLKDRGIIDLV